MTAADFRKLLRGDVLRWIKPEPGNGASIGLVRRVVDGVVYVVWEDGLDVMYRAEDARNLEHGP